jgi:4-oxalomesaconate tautomerase
MMIRGGSSRGAYFHRDDLPVAPAARDGVLVRAMGGPDPLQVDGIGGGHPLTNKVAVVSASSDADVDIDYLFLQVDPASETVSDAQNCGNILAGVGLYAIAEGLVEVEDPVSRVRVRMLNTGAICHLEMETPGGVSQTLGDTAIDGVPGTGAPIVCNYLDIAGSACGALLPTGNVVDEIDGLRVTCIDNGMPVVAILAEDLGITGRERPEALDEDAALKARLEAIRLQAGPLMKLGDVSKKSVPKMCMVSPAQQGGLIMTRTFIPHVCHKTIGVLGAVSAATACLFADSSIAGVANVPTGNPRLVDVEHAAGSLRVQLSLDQIGKVTGAGIVRTGRILFKGEIYV